MNKLFVLVMLMGALSAGVFAQNEIRSVDFKNFTFEITAIGEGGKEKVTVKDGSFDRVDEDGRFYFGVIDAAYGDLNGDGKEEAVVGVIFNTGGSGSFSSGVVYTMKGGKPVVVTEFDGGDRAYGGIVKAIVERGLLVVERSAPGKNGGACCPEFVDTSKYRLTGSKLTPVGKAVRRDWYPKTRVSFKKGTSLSTFPVTLEKNELKRFVVGARKGQTLLLSTNIEPVTALAYDLRSGNGDVEAGPNGLIIKLKENGDYVVEVANDTENTLKFSVTIEIR
jgi:hypothetical protein